MKDANISTVNIVISILIPAYNAEKFIAEALRSVFEQKSNNFEVIVVNDGSTDNTLDVLQNINDPRLKIYSQENNGVSATRNIAFAKSSGKYIYFFDADDIMATNTLSRCLQILNKEKAVVAVYGESVTFETNEELLKNKAQAAQNVFAQRPTGDITQHLLTANCIPCGGIMIRSEALKQTNGFSKDIKLGEDWALWVELSTKGPIEYIPLPPLMYYRQHPASAARNLAKQEDELKPAIDYIYSLESITNHFDSATLAKIKQQAWANAYSYSAQELLKTGQWKAARKLYAKSLAKRPFHIRTLLLAACSTLKLLPKFLKIRLK